MRAKGCPVPHCGGRVMADDEIAGRHLCNLAGHVAVDPEPGLLDKILSNTTPEHEQNSGPRQTGDLEALIGDYVAPKEAVDRAVEAIRRLNADGDGRGRR